MRAPTRESTRERMISIMARGSTIMVLVIGICFFDNHQFNANNYALLKGALKAGAYIA